MAGSRLARYAWLVLAFNLLVILWGAYVRATGSGAGCGRHWPLCDGEVVPRAPSVEKSIEFTHRASSGLALVGVVALAVAAFRSRPAGHPVRRAAAWALGLMLLEAALGAALVLFELVDRNASVARAVVVPIHLTNTLLLLAALAAAASAAALPLDARPQERTRSRGGLVTLLLLVAAGASGGIAALGDTLFPSTTLGEAMRQDLDATSHFLLRLRVAHPLVAATAAVAVLLLAQRARSSGSSSRWITAAAIFALSQLVVGLLNLALLAPIPVQLTHLLLADLLWVSAFLAWRESGGRRPAQGGGPVGDSVGPLPDLSRSRPKILRSHSRSDPFLLSRSARMPGSIAWARQPPWRWQTELGMRSERKASARTSGQRSVASSPVCGSISTTCTPVGG
jgi:cytochrome c oxidase assembly protein subunit 15